MYFQSGFDYHSVASVTERSSPGTRDALSGLFWGKGSGASGLPADPGDFYETERSRHLLLDRRFSGAGTLDLRADRTAAAASLHFSDYQRG
jgi:hypothetical protein